MYEDDDVWPIECPHCGHGFTAKIVHLKSGAVMKCVGCSRDIGHSAEQFHLSLFEARKGRHNPWWEMLRSVADATHVDQTPARPASDLVEQAFNLFLRMDAGQRAKLIARQKGRVRQESGLRSSRRRSG
jgi:hypothetical protein